MPCLWAWSPLCRFLRGLSLALLLAWAGGVAAQTCAAPGKDAPGAISGIVNRYYQGTGSPGPTVNQVTVGAASGAAGTVTVGDLLLIIQMQGATINAANTVAYGDGTGAGTATTTVSQANGYTALGQAGLYEFARVTAVAGNVFTLAANLTNSYVQDTTSNNPRRTYQVIRVPQLPSATIATAVTALPWTGLVGGVAAIDVAGVLTASGAGPHVDASNRGFRGGVHQATPNSSLPGTWLFRSTSYNDGGSKGEGIAGTQQYVQTSVAGSYNAGTSFSDANATFTDNGTGAGFTYPNGDTMRGAPANAGGGGNSHNAAGGGGGNGGEGGSGGQTYDGDTPSLADRGGYGGSRTPMNGAFSAARAFMGGAGGSGSMNNSTPPRASGGNGGGIVIVRAGRISGSLVLRADGQRGWDDDNGNDAGGGGGAGGTIVLTASSGHGNVTAQARGGNGANSNKTPRTGAPNQPCCDGEREGPGGGGGGGVIFTNASLGSTALGGGSNGWSGEDLYQGFSGNMLAQPGQPGAVVNAVASSSYAGVRPGYECEPALTVSKATTTPARTVPPATTGQYTVNIANPAAASGTAFGIAVTDILPSPFTLNGATFTATFSAGASGAGSTGPSSVAFSTAGAGTSTLQLGVPGDPVNAITLQPGANATITFNINLNSATAGTYQNSSGALFTDPTRTSGGGATAATNPTTTPGGTNAAGETMPGSNYTSASGTAEDIVVTGAAGTSADLGLAKTGPAAAEVGGAVQYTLAVTNSGPSNITGSVTISDNVPAAIGTVTWACTLFSGTGDCDTASGGTGAVGSGSAISLPRVAIASGAELRIVVSGIVATAGSITNTATVSLPAGFTDPVATNNTGTATSTFTVPTADLSVTKSDGITGIATNGVTAYTIVAANAGPSAANGAVVTDPAAANISKLSVSCSASGGASCPVGLTTATFEAGAAIPVFPAGGTVTFILNAQATAASGTVTNTVSITAPAGVTEINAANNTARDANAIVAAAATVASSAQICPAGTTESTINLLTNSNFADTSASVGSNVTQYAVNTAVADTNVAPQTGTRLVDNNLNQRAFPGDAGRSVPAANNWLYSNGNTTGAAYRIWSQTVSGLTVGTTYEWLIYGSNARIIGSGTANPPSIDFRVVDGTTTYTLGTANSFPNEGAGTSDTWTLRQRTFGATSTAATLQLWDTQTAGAGTGDNFGVTQILLRECAPNTDPFITKTNGTNTVQTFTTTSYVLTVGNNGPGPAGGILVRDPAATGLSKTAVSCSAAGAGAQCPLSLTVAGLEGTGLTVPALPIGTTLTLTVTASVTALNGSVTNAASITLATGMTDNNMANNVASDVDGVRGSAQLTVAKDNGVTSVVSGATTSYTITVANLGPSQADNAVVQDPGSAGLSCTTAVACNASGGASCGGANPFSVPIATLQGGFTIPTFPSGGSLTLQVVCTVTATGL